MNAEVYFLAGREANVFFKFGYSPGGRKLEDVPLNGGLLQILETSQD